MQNLKLISLRFKNFKGLKAFKIEPDGKDLEIKGQNATGKTTVFDGLTWLFFGKDSAGKADFQLKPVDKNGSEIHNLDTEVEGVISFKGKKVVLKRRFHEVYTRTSGSATKRLTGHTTDYFIDEVSTGTKKEYTDFIESIVDVNIFKLVTNPLEFNKLGWTDRRRILIEICGDVSDQDIINSDSKLAKLKDILGDLSIEKLKKKITAKKKEINKELELIPARIDEVTLSIKDTESPDPAKKEKAEYKLAENEEELRLLKSNEAISKKNIRVNEIRSKIFTEKTKSTESHNKVLKPIRERISNLETRKLETGAEIKNLEFSIKQDQDRNNKTEDALFKLREQFTTEQGKEVNAKTQCPACGQDLPEDEVDAAIEKFNQAKAETLKQNNAEGKKLKQGWDERQIGIEDSLKEIIKLRESLKNTDELIEKKKEELKTAVETPQELTDVTDLEKEQQALETEIKDLESGSEDQEKEVQIRIEATKTIIAEYDKLEAEFKASQTAIKRISELEEQESTLAREYERLEGELFLVQEFIIKKVDLLEDKINSMFKMATFKLFETQINQGINEVCETLYKGVPFNSALNNGAMINIGLDIIEALSKHYEFSAPIVIDNAESVNELIETDAQVITLTVTNDKELTVVQED